MTLPSGPRRLSSAASAAPGANPPPPPPQVRQRWRLRVAIAAPDAPAGRAVVGTPAVTIGAGADVDAMPPAASAARTWAALLATTGLPIAGEGAGRARVVSACPLPIGIAGEREVVDLYLVERLPAAAVRAAVTAALPEGLSLVDVHDVWIGAPSAPAAVVAADYRVLVAGPPRWAVEGAALALLGAATLPRERRREKKVTLYDLRPLILRLAVAASDASGLTLTMRLRHAPDAVGRPEEVVAALGEPPAGPLPTALVVRAIVREQVVMADDLDVPAAAAAPATASSPAPASSSAKPLAG